MRRWGSRGRIALIALGVAAILFVFVFPTQSYLAQRRQVSAAAHDVAVLREQNKKLQIASEQLQSPEETERNARAQFNMVFPGEQVYKVLPGPAPSTTTTVP